MIQPHCLHNILEQHAEEAAFLFEQRLSLVDAANIRRDQLAGEDNRLDAHLDGLRIAGEAAWPLVEATLESGTAGALFVATVLVLEAQHTPRLKTLLALADTLPEAQSGLASAFEWVAPSFSQPFIAPLLASHSTFYRRVGLRTCCRLQLDCTAALERAIGDSDAALQTVALQAAGEQGIMPLLPQCLALCENGQGDSRFWAARAALMLGDRTTAVAELMRWAQTDGLLQSAAIRLLAGVLPIHDAHDFFSRLVQLQVKRRLLICAAGWLGDAASVPGLLRLMEDADVSRIAGEAFSLITGVDLVEQNLDRQPPEQPQTGPSDAADDEDVASDPDEALPWPDPEKITQWWQANRSGFSRGQRCLLGAPATPEHCLQVLQSGYQPQRVMAALQLKWMNPAAALAATDAPAWRQ